MNTSENLENKMTRKEYIELARESGMQEEEINKYLKVHDDDDEKDGSIIIPYELLPLGVTIVETFDIK